MKTEGLRIASTRGAGFRAVLAAVVTAILVPAIAFAGPGDDSPRRDECTWMAIVSPGTRGVRYCLTVSTTMICRCVVHFDGMNLNDLMIQMHAPRDIRSIINRIEVFHEGQISGSAEVNAPFTPEVLRRIRLEPGDSVDLFTPACTVFRKDPLVYIGFFDGDRSFMDWDPDMKLWTVVDGYGRGSVRPGATLFILRLNPDGTSYRVAWSGETGRDDVPYFMPLEPYDAVGVIPQHGTLNFGEVQTPCYDGQASLFLEAVKDGFKVRICRTPDCCNGTDSIVVPSGPPRHDQCLEIPGCDPGDRGGNADDESPGADTRGAMTFWAPRLLETCPPESIPRVFGNGGK